jgi:hypothetical protein
MLFGFTNPIALNFTSTHTKKLCSMLFNVGQYKPIVAKAACKMMITLTPAGNQNTTVCVKDRGLHNQKYQYHNFLHV